MGIPPARALSPRLLPAWLAAAASLLLAPAARAEDKGAATAIEVPIAFEAEILDAVRQRPVATLRLRLTAYEWQDRGAERHLSLVGGDAEAEIRDPGHPAGAPERRRLTLRIARREGAGGLINVEGDGSRRWRVVADLALTPEGGDPAAMELEADVLVPAEGARKPAGAPRRPGLKEALAAIEELRARGDGGELRVHGALWGQPEPRQPHVGVLQLVEAASLAPASAAAPASSLTPPDPGQLAAGALLFASRCAPCHGALGDGRGAAAAGLDPPPTALREPAFTDRSSPQRAFQAISAGVPGTAMPAYGRLGEAERWALAFHVFALRHGAAPGAAEAGERALAQAGIAPLSLQELAIRSDRELAEWLGARLPAADLGPAIAHLRTAGVARASRIGPAAPAPPGEASDSAPASPPARVPLAAVDAIPRPIQFLVSTALAALVVLLARRGVARVSADAPSPARPKHRRWSGPMVFVVVCATAALLGGLIAYQVQASQRAPAASERLLAIDPRRLTLRTVPGRSSLRVVVLYRPSGAATARARVIEGLGAERDARAVADLVERAVTGIGAGVSLPGDPRDARALGLATRRWLDGPTRVDALGPDERRIAVVHASVRAAGDRPEDYVPAAEAALGLR